MCPHSVFKMWNLLGVPIVTKTIARGIKMFLIQKHGNCLHRKLIVCTFLCLASKLVIYNVGRCTMQREHVYIECVITCRTNYKIPDQFS